MTLKPFLVNKNKFLASLNKNKKDKENIIHKIRNVENQYNCRYRMHPDKIGNSLKKINCIIGTRRDR